MAKLRFENRISMCRCPRDTSRALPGALQRSAFDEVAAELEKVFETAWDGYIKG